MSAELVRVHLSTVEATFLRHAISVALRSYEFDDEQADALRSVSERLFAGCVPKPEAAVTIHPEHASTTLACSVCETTVDLPHVSRNGVTIAAVDAARDWSYTTDDGWHCPAH